MVEQGLERSQAVDLKSQTVIFEREIWEIEKEKREGEGNGDRLEKEKES